tara:strand:+ start:24 stop:197 length:174 start_codon:yes stop_codon:yes gene_type:complete
MNNNMEKEMSIIKRKKLNTLEVWSIVNEWYTNGMYPDILQNEMGHDLEEICGDYIDK